MDNEFTFESIKSTTVPNLICGPYVGHSWYRLRMDRQSYYTILDQTLRDTLRHLLKFMTYHFLQSFKINYSFHTLLMRVDFYCSGFNIRFQMASVRLEIVR